MIRLHSDRLEVAIAEHGAELHSLCLRDTGIEYLWQGDDRYWGKRSPVLFPIVGSLRDGTYTHEGNTYKLPRHGFARERDFVVSLQQPDRAIFNLAADDDTRSVYPFDFALQLDYKVTDAGLTLTYRVTNPADVPLLFSIGGHPAFRVPLTEGSAYLDHYLQFEQPEAMERWKLTADGLLSGASERLPLSDGRLALHPVLFYEDAIVLRHIHSRRVTLAAHTHPHGLHFHFDGFPYFGIWAAKDAPFVCLEPWCGHADWASHNGMLADKAGIQTLLPGETWERSWRVEVF